jgi:membrane AbrB-like protein
MAQDVRLGRIAGGEGSIGEPQRSGVDHGALAGGARPFLRAGVAQAAVLAAALAGGWAATAMGTPAGWMSGAMIAVTALAAAGLGRPFSAPLRDLVILLAGVSMGSGASPRALAALAHYPVSLAMMALAAAAMFLSSYAVLVRSPGFSRQTALFAAVPGALSYVFVAAQGTAADMPRVAVAQVFRIFVLMAIVPLLAARLGVGAPLFVSRFDPPIVTLALILAAAALGYGLTRLGMASGLLYAAIGVSVLTHGLGLAPGRPLPAIQIIAQALVGAWVGTRFIGFDWHLLRRLLAAASVAFAAALAAAAAFAAATSALIKVPFIQALVAFAPGGLEVMTMMAFALGLDPLFVGAHHLARFLLISLALPIVARFVNGSGPIGSSK